MLVHHFLAYNFFIRRDIVTGSHEWKAARSLDRPLIHSFRNILSVLSDAAEGESFSCSFSYEWNQIGSMLTWWVVSPALSHKTVLMVNVSLISLSWCERCRLRQLHTENILELHIYPLLYKRNKTETNIVSGKPLNFISKRGITIQKLFWDLPYKVRWESRQMLKCLPLNFAMLCSVSESVVQPNSCQTTPDELRKWLFLTNKKKSTWQGIFHKQAYSSF